MARSNLERQRDLVIQQRRRGEHLPRLSIRYRAKFSPLEFESALETYRREVLRDRNRQGYDRRAVLETMPPLERPWQRYVARQ